MLNYKGRYYTKEVLRYLSEIRDKLCELIILKTNDLGENTNLAAISASISTDFISTEFSSILVKGYSENIKDSFYYMGEENLLNLPEANKYYEDLKKVYESDSSNKGFEYFKLFYRYNYSITKCLKDALLKAERGESVPTKRTGASFSFDTSLDNIAILSGAKEDCSKMGIRIPDGDDKFVQIDGNDMYRSKAASTTSSNQGSATVSVVINIPYNDEKEISKKIYPVVSTYKGKPIEKVSMISATELIEMLKSGYNATSSNVIIDNESFYEQAEKISRQSLQGVVYFVTGKKKVYRVIECQKSGEWPSSVLKANNISDLSNVTLLTKRSFDLVVARNNEKNQSARKAA
jgi:hypothetical protein